GLSMVFGFVKQSYGHIKMYSEVGEGTTVRMYLPPAGAGAGAVTSSSGHATDTLQAGTETLLLVEDDELVRQYASTQLSLLGYRVIEAANGIEAIQVMRERDDIDLLFTDVVMPGGVNGPELAQQARELHPRLKVLYTSGYTQNAIVHHGRLDAGVLLLSKPYQRDKLARMVRQALDG
ncbi:MAG: response regulator, partial [Chromatocurvus sp.]